MSRAQMGSWESVVATCERLGVGEFWRLSSAETARRSESAIHRAGVFEAAAATV